MIINGKEIAEKIKTDLKKKAWGKGLSLAVVWVGDNPVSEKYIARKRKVGEEIGVEVKVYEYAEEISQEELEEEVKKLADRRDINGIIVQLPLPQHLDTEKILGLIPAEKDVDTLTSESRVDSPVVGAVKEILQSNNVKLENKRITVIGYGKLVGKPIAMWLATEGINLSIHIVSNEQERLETILPDSDIIISGAGSPGLIKPSMIKEGVVIIDAGTSESGGKLTGDADPACAEKCALFTPVPGGVGPLTVVMLFKNLLTLNS